MRQVKDVDLLLLPQLFGLLCGHCLELDRPGRVVAFLNGAIEILLGIVRRIVGGILLCDEFGALLGLHVHLSIYPVARFVDKLECMSSVSVHEAVAIRNTSVTHENHDLMDRFWVLRQVIPEHCAVIAVGEMCGWIALLGVDEVRELGGVSEEENGGIVCHHIPVSFLSPELDGKASRISSAVVGSRFATDS